jgi:HAD superfamily hydrolase (TIGR01509 family)
VTSPAPASLDGAPITAVLFDYGNTLITFARPAEALDRAYAEIARHLRDHGLAPPAPGVLLHEVHDRVEAELAAHVRSGTLEEIDLVAAARRAYGDLGLRPDPDVLDEALRVEQEAWWEGVSLDPQAIPTLTELRRRGLRIGLCSNAPYRIRSMHDQLVHFGLAELFDAVTFSAAVGWRKPSPRMFEAALAALGQPAARTVMVGDSENDDVNGARAVGMPAVLLRRSEDEPIRTVEDRLIVIRDLRELVALLFGDRSL